MRSLRCVSSIRYTQIYLTCIMKAHTLMKQFGLIRKSFGVSHSRTPTPEHHPHPPRAKRPIPDPNVSPPPNRIARAPTVPVLIEDDEPVMSSPEDPELEPEPSPLARKRKAKTRTSSSSRLPIALTKSPSPPPIDVIKFEFDEELGKTGKRRPTRRQSGLLTSLSITTVTTDDLNRPPSPVPGSPTRRAADEDEIAPGEPDEEEVEAILQSVMKRERKVKKERESVRARDSDADAPVEVPRPRERKKHRISEDPSDIIEGGKLKLKDVTNSRASLPLIDTTSGMHVHRQTFSLPVFMYHLSPHDTDRERQRTSDIDIPTSATSLASTSTRNFLSTPATTPAPSSKPSSQLPTPRSSSPIAPPVTSEPEVGGRERRVRKSINYAEPKLNTYVPISSPLAYAHV